MELFLCITPVQSDDAIISAELADRPSFFKRRAPNSNRPIRNERALLKNNKSSEKSDDRKQKLFDS